MVKNNKLNVISKLKEIASSRTYLPVPGLEVEVTDIETKTTIVYESIRKAALALNSDIKTILRREKMQK